MLKILESVDPLEVMLKEAHSKYAILFVHTDFWMGAVFFWKEIVSA